MKRANRTKDLKRCKRVNELQKKYEEYCLREFNDSDAVFGEVIGLAYTTVGNNEEYEIQVSYNVKEEYLEVSLYDGENECEFVYRTKESLQSMIGDVELLDFNDWYSYAHSIVDSKFKTDHEIEF